MTVFVQMTICDDHYVIIFQRQLYWLYAIRGTHDKTWLNGSRRNEESKPWPTDLLLLMGFIQEVLGDYFASVDLHCFTIPHLITVGESTLHTSNSKQCPHDSGSAVNGKSPRNPTEEWNRLYAAWGMRLHPTKTSYLKEKPAYHNTKTKLGWRRRADDRKAI